MDVRSSERLLKIEETKMVRSKLITADGRARTERLKTKKNGG